MVSLCLSLIHICHTQLNTEFVKTGEIDYMMSMVGEGKACWDCHRDVPHAVSYTHLDVYKRQVKDGDILLMDKEHWLVMMDFVDSLMVKTGID